MNLSVIYFIILCCCLIIVHKVFKLTNLINPFVLFYLYQTVFFFIGIFYAEYYEKYDIFISQTTKLFVVYAYVMSMIGALVALLYFRKRKNFQKLINEIVVVDSDKKVELHGAYFLLLIGYSFYFIYFFKSGFFPLYSIDIESARIEAQKGAGTIVILTIVFTSYSSLFIISHQRALKVLKVGVLFISTIVLLALASRAPVLRLYFCLLILILINRRIKIKIYHLVILGVSLFCLMVFLGCLRKGFNIDILQYMQARFAWRPFVTIMNTQVILDHFDNKGTMFGLSYWIELKTLLPGYQPNFGTFVKDILGLTFAGGSVTCSYLGIAYINFGIIGIIVFPFLFGFTYQSLFVTFFNSSHLSLAKIILFLEISLSLWGASTVGIVTPVLYLVIPYLIVFTVHVMVNDGIRQIFGLK